MESVHESVPMENSTPLPVNSVPPFLSKTFDMVDDPSTNDVVSWSSGNNSFVVWNVLEFVKDFLPKYFKHNNFSSFVRQLNTYGFRKVDPDRWEFANEGFLRGQKHLLKSIVRRKPAHVHNQQQPQVQNSSTGACVEVGNFGLEEEVEILKRDKNVLMQEFVRLRQQQQTTEHQLQTVGQKVKVMEQRQQQMMSFLAKAVQSPGFLNQLVQQNNDSNRRIAGSNKKRRLRREDHQENSTDGNGFNGPNRQIVKFQPSMNEAAKAMLRQILKMSSNPRLEPFTNNPGNLLLDNIPSSNVLDNGNSPNRVSKMTVSEVAPTSGQSHVSFAPTSELHSRPYTQTESVKTDQIPETNVLHSHCDSVFSNVTPIQGTTIRNNDGDSIGCEAFDGSMGLETVALSPDDGVDQLLDGVPKVPGIHDSFWEQFFAVSLANGDTDEITSKSIETDLAKGHESPSNHRNGWDENLHMDYLTDEMGILESENQRE